MIGDEVTVTVLGVKDNQVRLGVNAPKAVAVHREEIYERIKREPQSRNDPGCAGRPIMNPNTQTVEFSIRDLDGYYVTISALS